VRTLPVCSVLQAEAQVACKGKEIPEAPRLCGRYFVGSGAMACIIAGLRKIQITPSASLKG